MHVTDTYFIIAHFHYIMVGGTVMAYMGGVHFWWPKITGKMYPEWWGRFGALLVFVGFNLTFFPQFIARLSGHAAAISCLCRRVPGLQRDEHRRRVDPGGRVSSAAVLSDLVAVVGQGAPANPLGAAGLEWQTTSPPPTFNFDETPVVTAEAYDYEHIEVPVE